jgi:hypothetical protein
MNLTKSQDTKSACKNELHFYILTISNQKNKTTKKTPIPLTIVSRRIKYLG